VNTGRFGKRKGKKALPGERQRFLQKTALRCFAKYWAEIGDLAVAKNPPLFRPACNLEILAKDAWPKTLLFGHTLATSYSPESPFPCLRFKRPPIRG
jgi:hypothetical protein